MLKINKIVAAIVTIVGMASAAQAAVPGVYVGGQLGWGNLHQDRSASAAATAADEAGVTLTHESQHDKGIAGRAFVGYEFNPYFAAEVGYIRFTNAKASITGVGTTDSAIVNANETMKADAVDVVGKGIIPFRNGLSVYGKAGAAGLRERVTSTATESDGDSFRQTETSRKIYPTFGAGISYDITKNVVADISWNRIQKVGSSDTLESTDFAALGLAYHIG